MMNHSYPKNLLILLFIFSPSILLSQNLQTVWFDAKIIDSQTMDAEISTALDNQNNTHIAWMKD